MLQLASPLRNHDNSFKKQSGINNFKGNKQNGNKRNGNKQNGNAVICIFFQEQNIST